MSFVSKAATGHDNVAGLVRLNPQPWCDVPMRNAWVPSAIGDQPNGGQFSKLHWDGDMESSELGYVLTQLGFVSETPVAVTLTLPTGVTRTTGYFNCYVSFPKELSYEQWFKSPSLDVRIVEQIA